ncbi:hypothetical protein DASC09_042150 [Saccharomycopsis crataegensis]|uniref:Septin-type G domain-containing protein n=1 Tax=Saccharomycopsis crataegensis TaxID=43959 RepID=A0AAV5QRI6_9ASCO|nr:hypothetical protein DASC09_042150 [Saccharomycopsis crataegensis]
MLSPEELRRNKLASKPLKFSILVCGQSSSGKKTFINTLCNQTGVHINNGTVPGIPTTPQPSSTTFDLDIYDKDYMRLEQYTLDFCEPPAPPISLSISLTSGLGESVNNSNSIARITDFLDQQYSQVLQEEMKIRRNPRFQDPRVHAALYFINPTSHGLKPLDVELMKALSGRVNLVPVLGKADTMTKHETIVNKLKIMRDIKNNNIKVYDFANGENNSGGVEEQESNDNDDSSYLNDILPFTVIGSNATKVDLSGKTCHIRKYFWGEIDIEDPEICDFRRLKNILFGSHLEEFKDVTHDVLYERFRTEKLISQNSYNEVSEKL